MTPDSDPFNNIFNEINKLRAHYGRMPDAFFPVYEQILVAEEALYKALRISNKLEEI